MKKFTIIAIFLTLVSFGCKKEKSVTPIPTPAAVSYTSADSAVSGDWILSSVESYVSGPLALTVPHNDPVNCHLNLQLVGLDGPGGWKNAVYGLNCTNVAIPWRLYAGMIEMNGTLYTIISQSSTNMVLQIGSMPTSATKFYLYK